MYLSVTDYLKWKIDDFNLKTKHALRSVQKYFVRNSLNEETRNLIRQSTRIAVVHTFLGYCLQQAHCNLPLPPYRCWYVGPYSSIPSPPCFYYYRAHFFYSGTLRNAGVAPDHTGVPMVRVDPGFKRDRDSRFSTNETEEIIFHLDTTRENQKH